MSYFISEHSCHHPLVHGPGVFQPKRHHSIMVIGFRGDECCLFSVLGYQGNLIIPLKSVQKTHPWVSVCGIYQLINLRHRKWILNGFFGHALFKSMKSTQTLHLPFFFFITIVFANHSGKKISLIAPTSFNLLTSNFTASACSLADLLGFYFLGGNDGSTLSLWTMNSGSTPGTSYGLQAKTSIF